MVVLCAGGLAFCMSFMIGLTLLIGCHKDNDIHKIKDRFKKGEAAIAAARELIAVKGPSRVRFDALYEMLEVRERWSEAVEVFETARRLDMPTKVNPATAYEKLGRYDEALTWRLEEYRYYGPGAFTCANYSAALARVGRLDEARTILKRGEEELAKLEKLVDPKVFEDLRRKLDDCYALFEQSYPPAEEPRSIDELRRDEF